MTDRKKHQRFNDTSINTLKRIFISFVFEQQVTINILQKNRKRGEGEMILDSFIRSDAVDDEDDVAAVDAFDLIQVRDKKNKLIFQ